MRAQEGIRIVAVNSRFYYRQAIKAAVFVKMVVATSLHLSPGEEHAFYGS